MIKKTITGIIIVAMMVLLVTGINILDDKDIIDAGGGIHFRKVEGLDNIEMKDNNMLTWDKAEDADEYVLKINGKKYKTKENSFDLHNLPVGSYDIKIKGTKKGYRDSSYINQKIKIYSAQEIEDNLQKAISQKILQYDPSTRNPNVFMAKIQGNKIISFAEVFNGGHTHYARYDILLPENYDKNNLSNIILNRNTPIQIVYKDRKDTHKNYDFEKGAPLTGHIKDLQNNGWNIEKAKEIIHRIGQRDDGYYGNYVVIAKCTKGEATKYVYQIVNITMPGEHGSTSFARAFNKGELKKYATETTYEEFENADVLNEEFFD